MNPFTTDPFLGPLSLHGDELIGTIQLAATVREPRENGETDCEVLLRIGDPSAVTDLSEISRGSRAIQAAIASLTKIKVHGLAHAPRDWLERYTHAAVTPLIERLFVESFAVDQDMTVEVWFDFGDLDGLVVRTRDGECLAVEVHT